MWAVWWNSRDGVLCIRLALWKLCGFVGLLIGFQWPVNTWLKMGVLEAQDGVDVSPPFCPLTNIK